VEKRLIVLCCIIAILLAGNIFQFAWNNTSPSVDAVPDEETALKIAEAVLTSAYGDDVLSGDPLTVTFNESKQYWYACGSLPEGWVGGVPEIWIQKSDGRILKIYHGM